MTDTNRLAELRANAEKSQKQADDDRAKLLTAAVEEAVKSTKYGHLSAVAKDAGIVAQYLRDLIERDHPGWLARAAEEREAARATKSTKPTPTRRTARQGKGSTAA